MLMNYVYVTMLCTRSNASGLYPQNGWTPLIRASNEGDLKLMKVISDLGAYLNDQTEVRIDE